VGIPDDFGAETMEGRVLPTCLAEIDRCRPYFIGILGERYGWVPKEIPSELANIWPWLRDYPEHSVTALEMLHGVLRNPAMAKHAFFYFRDPAYLDTLSPTQQQACREESAQRMRRLAALKQAIRDSGIPVREPYHDASELGALVLRDMTGVIEELYPEESAPGALYREAMDHEAFAGSRARVYVGRGEYFDCLGQHPCRFDAWSLAEEWRQLADSYEGVQGLS
jgi:hypothetical protein